MIKKIIYGVASLILIGLIIGLVLIFKPEKEIKEEESVILEADNYRYENGKLIFLNKNGEDIGTYTCENKKETLCYVAYSSDEDNFDITQEVQFSTYRCANDNWRDS